MPVPPGPMPVSLPPGSMMHGKRGGGVLSPRGASGAAISPRRHGNGPPQGFQGQDVHAAVAAEKKERAAVLDRVQQKMHATDDELAEVNRKIEAMQLTLMDFQVVLTSHEREVEGLWSHSGSRSNNNTSPPPLPLPAVPVTVNVPSAEIAELRGMVHALSDRLEHAERTKPMSDGLPASTMELLFSQNREFMEELEAKLRATQDVSIRETERLDAQLGALRSGLHMVPVPVDIDARGNEARLARGLKVVQDETHAAWDCLAASLNTPHLPIETLADPVTFSKVVGVRDAILSAVSTQVASAVDVIRREIDEKSRQNEVMFKRVNATVQRTTLVQEQPNGVEGLRRQVEGQLQEVTAKLNAQQLSVVDTDRRLSERVKGLTETCQGLENVVGRLEEEDRMRQEGYVRDIQEVLDQCARLRTEQLRGAEDLRNASMAIQDQCNDVLQRHMAEVHEHLRGTHDEMKAQLHANAEKVANAARLADASRKQLDEMNSAMKRNQSQIHEMELARKDEGRRVQQQTTDAVSRVQQLMSADLHRLQKETAQEMQRYEDAASSLYRTVEELRGVQQRTLEEYHRQGDEQAMLHAKLQQQLTEVNSVLKDQLTLESDRLQSSLRSETQTLNDALIRVKTELGERVGAVERRTGETETVIDAFRGRLRALEINDSAKLEKTVDDLRHKNSALEGHLHSLEGWRSEAVAKMGSLETRVNEAGNAGQLQVLGRKVDDLERSQARGADKEEMRRILRSELDSRIVDVETKVDAQFESMHSAMRDSETAAKSVKADVAKLQGQVRANKNKIDAVDAALNSSLTKLKEGLVSEVDTLSNKLKSHQKEFTDIKSQCERLHTLMKARDARDDDSSASMARYAKEFAEMKENFRDLSKKSDNKMRDFTDFVDNIRKEFEKMQDGLQENSAADEQRGQELKALVFTECDKMRVNFEKLISAIKADIELNSREDEARSRKMENTFEVYTKQFEDMRRELEANREDDEKREDTFNKMVNELVEKVDTKNRKSAEEMLKIHEAASQLFEDMQHELTSWRDRVASNESTIKELQGYVTQVAGGIDQLTQRFGTRLQEVEEKLETDMQKVRRALEKQIHGIPTSPQL